MLRDSALTGLITLTDSLSDMLLLSRLLHVVFLIFFCLVRAFDTLAKALHPADGSVGESLEATMQLMSGDQSGPVVELEGSLLSDIHIPFKVPVTQRYWCS